MSHVGKCPNTRCSDYAVLNGHNPGGVRDCAFITGFTAEETLDKSFYFALKTKISRVNFANTFEALIGRTHSLKTDLF